MAQRSSRAVRPAIEEPVDPPPAIAPVPDPPPPATVHPIHPRKRSSQAPGALRRRNEQREPQSLLWYGDNLNVLREHVRDDSVDLVYLDPPFNSNRSYNVIFRGPNGLGAPAQIQAFDDTWRWSDATTEALDDIRRNAAIPVQTLIDALVHALDRNDVTAYLVMMTQRLVELRRAMKPNASLYLHCDPTASHYLKIVLDTIFGPEQFINEVVWQRQTAHSDGTQGARHYGRLHDVLLVYAKSPAYTWNRVYGSHSPDYLASHYRLVEPGTGRLYELGDMTGPGGAAKGNPSYEVMGITRHWRYSRERMEGMIAAGKVVQPSAGAVPRFKRYLDESPGRPLQDIWNDIAPLNSQAQERLGYPTQKPLALLERIIAVSSNPGELVLDPFCGCGTAVDAAERLDRRWIGIDVTSLAVGVIEKRLDDNFEAADFKVMGLPETLDDARDLAGRDRYQFQWWAAGRIGARPHDGRNKKGRDRGVDGIIPFYDDPSGRAKRCIVSVKSGQDADPGAVRDLLGTVVANEAETGVFVTLKAPTPEMKAAAAQAGLYHSPLGVGYPKIQILTIEDILSDRLPDLPDQESQRRRRRRIAAQRAAQQPLPNWT